MLNGCMYISNLQKIKKNNLFLQRFKFWEIGQCQENTTSKQN